MNEASALETTIERIRQRYALHFHMPPDAGPGQERHVDVQLVAAARQRYPDAELRFRRTYLTSRSAAEPSRGADSPTLITGAPAAPITPGTTASSQGNSPAPALKRRTAISEPDSAHGPLIVDGNSGSSRPSPAAVPASVQPSQPSATPTVTQQSPDSTPEQPHRGWRRVQPGDQQQ